MSAIGWSGLSALVTEIAAHSSGSCQFLSYSIVAIAICGGCTASLAVKRLNGQRPATVEVTPSNHDETEMVMLLAEQSQFAETRVRLLALAEDLRKR